MSDPTAFEIRLRVALRRHVAAGPTVFDALEFARMVASTEPRRRGLLRGLTWRRPATDAVPWHGPAVTRFTWLAVALLLVVALIAGALVAGGLRVPARWQRLDLPGAGTISAAFASDRGCLAVGSSVPLNKPPWYTPLVWTSADCLHWDAAASAPSVDWDVAAITAGDDGLVAVGSANGSLAVWRSTDGRTWRRATTAAGDRPSRLWDVAFADGRYVAVGGGPQGAEIWWSGDGEHWVAATGFAAFRTPGFFADMLAVVAGGPGFVAVGGTPVGGVWTSTDGDAWQRVDLGAYDYRNFRAAAVGPDGLLLALTGTTLLVSPDPAALGPWTPSSLPAPADLAAFGPGLTVDVASLTATDWGYVAVGALGPTAGSDVGQLTRGLVWTSRDGRTWQLTEPGPTFAGVALERVSRSGDALLVVGRDGSGSLMLWAIAQSARSEDAIP